MTDIKYDWDTHFSLRENLMALEDYRRQLITPAEIDSATRKKHLTHEFHRYAGSENVEADEEFWMHFDASMNRLVGLLNRHAMFCAGRGERALDYLTELVETFPEKRWEPFVVEEGTKTGILLRGLKAVLQMVEPFYTSTRGGFYSQIVWVRAMQANEIAHKQFFEISQDYAASPDKRWVDTNVLRFRADRLSELQRQIASDGLTHAFILTKIARETLGAATIIDLLNEQDRPYFENRRETIISVAQQLFTETMTVLEESAKKQSSAFMNKDLQRPVF